MHHQFGYHTADSWYETTVDRLVDQECFWIDVGGGASLFPNNPALAKSLADRCSLLVGVDPSDNIAENSLVQERAQCFIEDYEDQRQFDVATLRMVAEHIQHPERVVASLARLMKPGGKVVVLTPNRWSITSIAASVLPYRMHQLLTGFLWKTRDEDVFPTVYAMNTRRQLRAVFEQGGFKEAAFSHLDNCGILQRFRWLYFGELLAWRAFRACGLKYPQNNLLGVYEKL
jgi:SAM-dependent methyltransferase